MDSQGAQVWHQLTSADVIDELNTDSKLGLNSGEVKKRQEQHGPNSIPAQAGQGAFMRFLMQFHQALVYILLAAAIITFLLHEYVDSAVIFGVVLVNAVLGFLQESKAAKALEALSRTTSTEARVIREGKTYVIPSAELVPGDVVLLQSGDRTPADLRLIQTRDLQIDESALTGESVPVEKSTAELEVKTPLAERKNMAYASTLVTYGQGRGVVASIGGETEVGRISHLISTADVLETPLTQKIGKFSHLLLIVILVLAGLTFGVGVWRGEEPVDMFMAAVALAVGAIPEGLPAAVTITLAIGVARMARQQAIIRKLPAVETLGSTTVICSDKTGTLTVNQMTVQQIWAGQQRYLVSGTGYNSDGEIRSAEESSPGFADNQAAMCILKAGILCNDSQLVEKETGWAVQGDPTEGALLVVAYKAGLSPMENEGKFTRVDSIPFESQYQYMATLNESESTTEREIYVKGAVEVLLEKCRKMMSPTGELIEISADQILKQVETMAAAGLRVLAFAGRVCLKEKESIEHAEIKDLVFYGLQGMIDPPREEVVASIAACQKAGIQVKMITGDHALTARSIAEQLGLKSGQAGSRALEVMTAADLEGTSEDELATIAERVAVFARATPELKLRLVRALQSRGHVTAMTGDGVNDAPALKQADIGVAMGITGTEVAKEAADMVLTDDNFSTIRAAVEEGRGVFDNLTKFIVWTLPTNIGEGLVILAAVLVGSELPILPVQILWINMTTAVLLGLMLAFEPKEPDIMDRAPRDPETPILTGYLIFRICMVGVLLLLGAFGSFHWAMEQGYGEEIARTIAVNVFVMVELFYLFNCRSLTKSMFKLGLFSNLWIGYGVGIMLALQIAFTYLPSMNRIFQSAPINLESWVRILLTAFAVYAIVGVEKAIYRWWISRQETQPK